MIFGQVKGRDDPDDYKKLREILREIWGRFGRDWERFERDSLLAIFIE